MTEMSDASPPGNTFRDHMVVYSAFRSRIVDEDRLINDRMCWMIFSEGILFALFGAVATRFDPPYGWQALLFFFFLGFIILTGAFIAILSHTSIAAARREIGFQIEKYKKSHARVSENGLLPNLIGSDGNHIFGNLLPKLLPGVFAFVWLFASAYAISRALR